MTDSVNNNVVRKGHDLKCKDLSFVTQHMWNSSTVFLQNLIVPIDSKGFRFNKWIWSCDKISSNHKFPFRSLSLMIIFVIVCMCLCLSVWMLQQCTCHVTEVPQRCRTSLRLLHFKLGYHSSPLCSFHFLPHQHLPSLPLLSNVPTQSL